MKAQNNKNNIIKFPVRKGRKRKQVVSTDINNEETKLLHFPPLIQDKSLSENDNEQSLEKQKLLLKTTKLLQLLTLELIDGVQRGLLDVSDVSYSESIKITNSNKEEKVLSVIFIGTTFT